MTAVGGCSTPFLVHTVNELQNGVFMSFGSSLTHLPLGVEVGSGEGWAPETADLVPLHACNSAASSPSHACGQLKTFPLVKELTIPPGGELLQPCLTVCLSVKLYHPLGT